MVKNPLAKQETWVRSLGQEDPLEKDMATHSRILAWRIPWTEEPGGLQSMESQRVGRDCTTKHRHTVQFGHLIHRAHSLQRPLMLEKIESRKRRGDSE